MTIQLNCFPSRSFVRHYASLVATYLALCGRDTNIVQMSLPRPEHAAEVIHKSNLRCVGHVDLAIFGDIHHLEGLLGSTWQGDGRSKHDIFRWQTRTTAKGKRVALIGCLEKIWGEAGSHIIQTLHGHSRVKHVVYVAKAGSLSAKYHLDRNGRRLRQRCKRDYSMAKPAGRSIGCFNEDRARFNRNGS